MNWQQVCDDKNLADLPYKIELNRHGQIVMSPTRNKHGFYQSEIAFRLKKLLPKGFVLIECAVDTAPEGTFVADVVWASAGRFAIIKEEFSCSVAPEICVEVLSWSNTAAEIEGKRTEYFRKGAFEFWLCDLDGNLTFFNHDGALSRSVLCPKFPLSVAA